MKQVFLFLILLSSIFDIQAQDLQGVDQLTEKEFRYNRSRYASIFNLLYCDFVCYNNEWLIYKDWEGNLDTLCLKLYELTSSSYYQGQYTWQSETDNPDLDKRICIKNTDSLGLLELLCKPDKLFYTGAYTPRSISFKSKPEILIKENGRLATQDDIAYFKSLIKEEVALIHRIFLDIIKARCKTYHEVAKIIRGHSLPDYLATYVCYKYVTSTTNYDYAYRDDHSIRDFYCPTKVFRNKKGVCGEISWYYRWLLNSVNGLFDDLNSIQKLEFKGYSCQTIVSDNHSWNVIALTRPDTKELVYFELDPTWDLGKDEFEYFLSVPLKMPLHKYVDESLEFYSLLTN